ncbi:hypothetical protein PIB30_009973 [Stylosanthes scabra]|uniref:Uncharacterized protein n=1 Tax=Stylosanthes scabra TaxID=79078 RepID=A0ABU6U417_9FABA|nr:hypothetical protein [Stylosanthes scabra]
MEHYNWYPPYSAKHLMRQSSFGGRSDGRYEEYWRSPEYQVMRRANKANRASRTGGSLHMGIRPPIRPLQRIWRQRLGAFPRRVGYFCDPTPRKRIGAEMKRLENEHATHIAAGEPSGPPIDEDEVCERIAGGRRRGRIYGKGKVPKRPVPQLVDPEDTSTCSGLDVREHITLMNQEIQQQAEEYKREMEAWKKRYETNVTCLQTTLDTQSAKFDQWKCHISQMYTFMQQMQSTSTSTMPPPPIAARPPRPPPATTTGAQTRSDSHLDDGSSSGDGEYD